MKKKKCMEGLSLSVPKVGLVLNKTPHKLNEFCLLLYLVMVYLTVA